MRKTSIAAVLMLAALTRTAAAQDKSETGWTNAAAVLAATNGIAAVKTNAPAAVAAVAAPVYTPALLLNTMSRAALETLYKTLKPGDIPNGPSNGLASSDPGTKVGDISEGVFGLLWKGKVFDRAHGQLINRILGTQLITAKVFVGPSWLDGKPAIIIDYQNTSVVAGFIRDEIREVSPGVYFGFAYERQLLGAPRADIVFALDFNTPKAAPATQPSAPTVP